MFEKIQRLKLQGLKIGFTASTFDLLHAGHIEMLSKAKADCDFLVVGILTDPTISRPQSKLKPLQSMLQRFIQLQGVKYVDMIIPFDTEEDLQTLINLIHPDIRFVGQQYKGTLHTGWGLCNIKYNQRKHHWSSTQLKNRLKQQITNKDKEQF